MKFLILLATIAIASTTNAESLRSPSLNIDGKKGVYLDFVEANHKIVYDINKNQAKVFSSIKFILPESGYPVYDQVENPEKFWINDEEGSVALVEIPDARTKVRVVKKEFPAGKYTMRIITPLKEVVSYSGDSVSSAFWMSDLSDRSFLEKYLPSSFEYDQVKFNFLVQIKGTTKKHRLVTNGKIKELAPNEWSVEYPKFYTSSSIFYHLFPLGDKREKTGTYRSIDNREIPILAYTSQFSNLTNLIETIKKYMKELEELYGPWPHDFNIVYLVSPFKGGMEYSGATWTSSSALRHELNHYYFARNVMPSRGNAGWIDEAIASWADNYYPETDAIRAAGLASHSVYQRTTDRGAYTLGERLLAYMHKEFKPQGGFQKFLRHYFEKRNQTVVSTKIFQKDIEEYFNTDMASFFNTYVYSKKASYVLNNEDRAGGLQTTRRSASPHHRIYSKKELLESL